MSLLPVIERELRASARHPFTYYLRSIGTGALLLTSFLFGFEGGFDSNLGGKLFGYLHFTMFCGIWILVPLLAADCISRERREGTLGLLFMTGLCGSDIVLAKSLAHGLRALTLWVAAAPVLTVSFLLGGVSWQETMLSVVINSSAMCWALAAGVLGSVWSKTWGGAILRAAIFAMLFLLLMAIVTGCGLGSVLRSGTASFWGSSVSAFFELEPSRWDYVFLTGIGFLTNLSTGFAAFVFQTVANGQLVWLSIIVSTISLLGALLAICLAGTKTGRVWREAPPSIRQIWLEKTFCTPFIWLSFFHAWMKRKLEKNPVGWLEQRTWSGRLLTWGWLAVIVSLYSVMLSDTNFFRRSSAPQNSMAWLLVLSMAISTAGSFRRERESGVLELLLVSPISEHAIVWGRLRGLWSQFLPSFALLLLVWMYLASLSLTRGEDGSSILFYAGTFVSFPIIGLYFSLRCRAFMTALLAALVMSMVVPLAAGWIVAFWMGMRFGATVLNEVPFPILAAIGLLAQAMIACHYLRRLQERLKSRSFPLERASV